MNLLDQTIAEPRPHCYIICQANGGANLVVVSPGLCHSAPVKADSGEAAPFWSFPSRRSAPPRPSGEPASGSRRSNKPRYYSPEAWGPQ